MTSVYPSNHLSLKKYTENKCVFAFVNDTRCSIFTGKVLQHLFGICTEALYCGKAPSARCIWRPGALPNECELFYGFSRFAIELNEILETERYFLPKTDTRFRPDQRALEVSWARVIRKFAIQLFQCLILNLESWNWKLVENLYCIKEVLLVEKLILRPRQKVELLSRNDKMTRK